MPASHQNIQKRLQAFDFAGLFTQELMWNRFVTRDLPVPVDGVTYTLKPVAQRGMAVFECVPPTDAQFPKYPTRRKIDTQVSKTAREHIIIFHDHAQTVQVWQWVRREAGKPSACREQLFYKGQSGDALAQKIQGIAFGLEDEPNVAETVTRVGGAFDVERVTKKFYDLFKKEHDAFLRFVSGIPDEHLERWYVSVMLNRLMFIYFIQKKGFLGGDLSYLSTKLAESQERGKDRFYRDFLCPLFFEGFARRPEQRDQAVNKMLGSVPYLNGGLFLKHQIEELHGKKITISDRAFERILNFFEQYDWHLDDRPTRKGNEINPDVLGYVFEKYINQKEMGAYYTKEDITGYISQSTIIPALFDMARKSCRIAFEGERSVWELLKVDPDRYIYAAMLKGLESPLPENIAAGLSDVSKREEWNKPADTQHALPTETWREVVARRSRCEEIRGKLAGGEIRSINDFVTYNLDIRRFVEEVIANCEGPELLRAFYKAVRSISVLDPACGSGAFLFAALTILEGLYDTCLVRMQAFADDLDRSREKHSPEKFKDFRETLAEMNDKARHPSPRYFILKSIILNNLYGVDLMEEATEICKLRLFLKMVAQINQGEKIEPLPDIDFNIRAGNTLVGFATETELNKIIGGRLDFDNKCADIKERAQLAELAYERFRQMQVHGSISHEQFSAAKSDVQKRLMDLRAELDAYLSGDYRVSPRDKAALKRWRESHRPFHWFVEFYGVMRDGGFDTIIGNPPYVELSDLRGAYSLRNLALTTTGNLYSVFIERITYLLSGNGRVGVIVPISSVSTPRMAPLMELITQAYAPLFVSNFSVRPGKLFVGADMNLTVIVGQKVGSATRPSAILSTSYNRWSTEARPFLFTTLRYQKVEFNRALAYIPKVGTCIQAQILKKLATQQPLGRFRTKRSGDRVYYHSGGRYFRKCLPEQLSNEYKELVVEKDWGNPVIALLSSSLYYLYWIFTSDCYHVTNPDVDGFPVPAAIKGDEQIESLVKALISDLWDNAEIRTRVRADGTKRRETNFRVGKSKAIIDSIDNVLAQYYSLSDVELDYVRSYDFKYRFENGDE